MVPKSSKICFQSAWRVKPATEIGFASILNDLCRIFYVTSNKRTLQKHWVFILFSRCFQDVTSSKKYVKAYNDWTLKNLNRRVRNQSNISLEGNLGAILILSWLVKPKFWVKMGKLTPFGPLRGTKLALRRALEAPKEAPRGPKRVRGTLIMLQGVRDTPK